MCKAGEYHVFQLFRLFPDCLIDARIGMTEQVYPPGTDRIDIAMTVIILEKNTLAFTNWNHWQRFVVLHLRTWMPDYGQIAFFQSFCHFPRLSV